jgi:hypothetical protein
METKKSLKQVVAEVETGDEEEDTDFVQRIRDK